MKKKHLALLLIVARFVCSCDTSNTGNTSITGNKSNAVKQLSDDEYFAQQALKNNYSDKILLGLSFSMSKEQVMTRLEEIGAFDIYSSYFGQERRRLLERGELRSLLPSDFCGPNEAFSVSKIILKSEDGEYSENTGTIKFNFDRTAPYKPYEVKVYLYGFSNEKATLYGDGKTFRSIKAALVEKYGNPYKETDEAILWVDGIIHITLTFEGMVDTSLRPKEPLEFGRMKNTSASIYQPEYLISYSDWTYSQKKEAEWNEYERQEQERLKKEYTSGEYNGL